MAFELDPQLVAVMAEGSGDAAEVPENPDAMGLRRLTTEYNLGFEAGLDPQTGVTRTDHAVPVPGGTACRGDGGDRTGVPDGPATILARWYTRGEERPGSALLYFHGGGRIGGSVEEFDRYAARHVADTGVPLLSVEYRLAPEFGGETAALDGLSALVWLRERAGDLGVDPDRIAVMGDSAGGGVAASVAIAARSENIPVAFQLLIYPMLDDRTREPDPELEAFAGAAYQGNIVGWDAVLGDGVSTGEIGPLTAAGRETEFAGLPAALIDVGELDIFRDEAIRYATGLLAAGVSTELHVRPGLPHGLDRVPVDAADRSREDRYRIIAAL